MNKVFKQIFQKSSGIFKYTWLFFPIIFATEASSSELSRESHLSSNSLGQVTSVSQLKDVQPNDWAWQALQSLVDRYGCIQGTSNNTFQGNRSLTRYEFAAALNACLSRIENLANFSTLDRDLSILKRLQTDFAIELNKLGTQVTNLETRIDNLEETQFSTTTQLRGEVLFQLADSFGDSVEEDENDDNSQTFLGYRTRLNFDTSFTGKDLLRTRIESLDIANLEDETGTFTSRLGTDGSTNDRARVQLIYNFPVGESTEIFVSTTNLGSNDIGQTVNPLSSSGRGAVSRFGRRDPLTLRGPGGAGIGVQHEFNDYLEVNVGYTADDDDAGDPDAGRGLFNGSYSAIAQLFIEPSDYLNLALTYTHLYQRTDEVSAASSTGSANANNPFGENATSSDNLGFQFNWRVNPKFEFGGWFGYANTSQQRGGNSEATILNGALTFAFPDLFAEDNLGGIIVGIPPLVTDRTDENAIDDSTALHIEGFYRIKVNDRIEVTPGVFVVTNPDFDEGDPIWVGTIRTRFSF
jgi:Carbohydrate-selective porin, OprB family/S-layer homology domain